MNWDKLIADKNVWMNKHYTIGREGHKIEFIVIHHNAGLNMTTEDCYRAWQSREASAHYQVERDGTVGQLVGDDNTAWHAGNWGASLRSIGIEHANITAGPSWDVSAATIDAGAHLVAAICRFYELGVPQWGVNVFPHSHFSSTACPFALRDKYRAEYMRKAVAYYDLNSTTKTIDGKSVTMKCDFLIFESGKTIYVASLASNTYWGFPSVATMNDWVAVHKRLGATIHYWSQYKQGGKDSKVDNPAAFGALVK